MEEIKEYYNKLAPDYDRDRFGNSYGKYIDRQEKAFVRKLLRAKSVDKTLDVGCGTGRFLEFACYGIDLSEEMIDVAQRKFPGKKLSVANVTDTPFENSFFETALSFHLFMHLDKQTTQAAFNELQRILKPGGTLILDFPSKKRRELLNHKQQNWHGANELTTEELKVIASDQWKLKETTGIAFLPVHSIPKYLRKIIITLDSLICRTFLKEYASYIVFVLEKK